MTNIAKELKIKAAAYHSSDFDDLQIFYTIVFLLNV
jgi:hypothetical protein